MSIRLLERKDYDSWYPLWQENCLHQISDEVTAETWRRLTNKKEAVFGIGMFDDEENLLGFLHYILHPVTGFKEHACYMQDLYVAENSRRQGIARRLVWELDRMRKEKNWARIYWFAEHNNAAAQNLYKNLGVRMDFSLHILQT